MCDQRSCAREAFQSEPGVVLFRRLVRSCAYNPTPVTLARLYEVSSRDGLRLREPRYVLELVRNAFLAKHKEQHVGERTKNATNSLQKHAKHRRHDGHPSEEDITVRKSSANTIIRTLHLG